MIIYEVAPGALPMLVVKDRELWIDFLATEITCDS